MWCCPAARGGLVAARQSRCCGGGYQSSHSDQVVGRCHQIASQLGPLQAAVTRPLKPADCLHPAKDLLDSLADALADGVTNVPRRASVDGAASPTGVLRYVWRDLSLTQLGDGPALTSGDIVGPAIATEDLFRYSSLNPAMGATIRGVASLAPRTLALMHGPSYAGDGAAALRALADDYDRRVRQMTV